jgi:hypothetical protein
MNGNPKQLAEKGEAIYKAKYQTEYEQVYPGKYVAIDVTTEKAYVADTPERAIENLQSENAKAFFHLIRVGSLGVVKVGFSTQNGDDCNWLL